MNQEKITNDVKLLTDAIDNAFSYCARHGKNGKWSYEMLIEALDKTKEFLKETQGAAFIDFSEEIGKVE